MTPTASAFDSEALPLLLTLEEQGFEFRAASGALFIKPAERVTPELHAQLRQHRPALITLVRVYDQGVQDRVQDFRGQLEADPTTIGPFLFKAGIPYRRGDCFSCGATLPEPQYGRCWRCSLAWRMACRLPIPTDVARAYDESKVVA
jgi:hypothetical protein